MAGINVGNLGSPGVGAVQNVSFGLVSYDGVLGYKIGGGLIKNAKARDPYNTDDIRLLQIGTLMAKHTSDGSYAPLAIGITAAATLASATALTISAASAVELVRRVGSSGTFSLIGPPAAAGTVATQTVTFSAVNTTSGVVTCSAITAATIAGSFVSETTFNTPTTFIGDDNAIYMPATADMQWPRIPVSGYLRFTNLLNEPTDTSLITWVKTNLSTTSGGKFIFHENV